MCFGGASSTETGINSQQQQMLSTLMGNYQQQFGNQSSILSNLTQGASAIYAQGPGQYGFTPQENAALMTQAGTNTAQAYQGAKQAANESLASVGGGNVLLPSGTAAGINANIAQAGAQQQANAQLGVTEAGYQQGLANYNQAASVLGGVAQQYNPLGYAGQSTSAGQSAFSGASAINQQNQAAQQEEMSLIGGAAGGLLTGGASTILGGLGGSGGMNDSAAFGGY